MDLTSTILIKLDDVALAVNNNVISKHGYDAVNTYDPSSWKYYQNISGTYHFSDEIMLIKSLDLNIEIQFTVANLAKHKLTKKAYVYGSRYYKELVSRYPDQETLILGILYPTDINVAISAANGTILNYPKELVEVNEYSLINKLQDWVNKFLFRWVNRQYTLVDDLYVATYVYQLFSHLLMAIISYRLEMCKTNEAHSYHVRTYLASHGFLDYYLNALTLKQTLFFYKNIRYIERHSGKADTFDWLVDHTLTERAIPIYELKIAHNTSGISSNIIPNKPNADQTTDPIKQKDIIDRDPTPDIDINRKPINKPADNNIKNSITLDDGLDLIKHEAPNNDIYQIDNHDKTSSDLKHTDNSSIKTKLLQTYLNENGNIFYYTLEDIVYNHWIYLSAKDRYKASVFITLPKNNENIVLTAQQAVGLYMYCTAKAYMSDCGLDIDNMLIPKVRVNRVIREDIVTIEEISEKVDTKILSPKEINEILDTTINIKDFYSIPDFTDLCLKIYSESKIQYSIYTNKEQMDRRAYAQTAVDTLYCDETVVLDQLVKTNGSVMTYKDLLLSLNLDMGNYSNEDLLLLGGVILTNATLIPESESVKLSYIQKSMSSLLLQLSSYSIQIVNEFNDLPTRLIPSAGVRVGYQYNETFTNEYLNSALVKIREVFTSTNFKVFSDIDNTIDDNKESQFKSTITFSGKELIYEDIGINIYDRAVNTVYNYGYQYTGLRGISESTSTGIFNLLPAVYKDSLLRQFN